MVTRATETSASQADLDRLFDFVKSEFKAQREYFEMKLAMMAKEIALHTEQLAELRLEVNALKSEVADIKSEMATMRSEIAAMRSEMAMQSKDLRLQLVYAVIAVVALMQGLNWLFGNLG